MRRSLRPFLLILSLLPAWAGAEEDAMTVRHQAAEVLSLHLKSAGSNHLVKTQGSAPHAWTEIEGLRLGDVAPQPLSPAEAEAGITARYLVAVEATRHRSTHQKLRRWQAWKPGLPAGFPAVLDVRRSVGKWQVHADGGFQGLARLQQVETPSSVPQDTTPALPMGSAIIAPPPSGDAAQPRSFSTRKSLIGLAVVAALAVIALITGRILANRGILTSPRPVASPGGAIAALRRRLHLLDPSEQHFFLALDAAVRPGRIVSAKVRLADLFEAAPGPDGQQAAQPLAGRHADFVITDAATSRILAIVQLLDPSDTRPATSRRHEFIRSLCSLHGVPHFEISIAPDYSAALESLRTEI